VQHALPVGPVCQVDRQTVAAGAWRPSASAMAHARTCCSGSSRRRSGCGGLWKKAPGVVGRDRGRRRGESLACVDT